MEASPSGKKWVGTATQHRGPVENATTKPQTLVRRLTMANTDLGRSLRTNPVTYWQNASKAVRWTVACTVVVLTFCFFVWLTVMGTPFRQVRNQPATWLVNGLRFTDLTFHELHDYVDPGDEDTLYVYSSAALSFLRHIGHETGAVPHPNSRRAIERTIREAMEEMPNGGVPLYWLLDAFWDVAAPFPDGPTIFWEDPPPINALSSKGPHPDDSVCLWMFAALVKVQEKYGDARWVDAYDYWLPRRVPAMNAWDVCHVDRPPS